MRKKSDFTFVEQSILLVPEFERVVRKLEQQVKLRGQSKSTHHCTYLIVAYAKYCLKSPLSIYDMQVASEQPGDKKQKLIDG